MSRRHKGWRPDPFVALAGPYHVGPRGEAFVECTEHPRCRVVTQPRGAVEHVSVTGNTSALLSPGFLAHADALRARGPLAQPRRWQVRPATARRQVTR